MQGIKILGTGSYIPPQRVTNEDFTKIIDTSDEWITTRTGIKERRFNTGKTTFYMAEQAAKAALENARLDAKEIDLIIVSTCTPDFLCPSVSCLVQHLIGADNAFCMDVSCACTGFIAALDLARRYLITGDYRRVMVIASEYLTQMVDYSDRGSCVLFGDGAAALVAEAADKKFYSAMGAKGDMLEALWCRINYQNSSPFTPAFSGELLADVLDGENKKKYLQMDGRMVYKFAVEAMPKAAQMVFDKSGLSVEDVDILIPHQANIRIIQTAVKAMGISADKVALNIEERGNTSSACIPTCLDQLNREGKLLPGTRVMLVGFGAGLTYGAVYLEI